MKKGMLAALLCLFLLSGCGGKPEPIPLEELPQDYSLEQAKADGCLVTENGTITSGQERWEDFLEAVDAGKAASVRLCNYFTLDSLGVSSRYDPDYYASIKNDYPKMSLEDLSYDGEGFTSVSYQEGTRCEWSYSLLRRFEEEAQSSLLPYDLCISYILTDDAEATYDQLLDSLASSQLNDHIPFHIVYREEIALED
ncbi:MAG: hypothetical protein HFG05_11410 [Oscillibacter sp.]|nr:hypothetical protein [Oscillibacter sp.]